MEAINSKDLISRIQQFLDEESFTINEDRFSILCGQWLNHNDSGWSHNESQAWCNICGKLGNKTWKYCPYCGARMRNDL